MDEGADGVRGSGIPSSSFSPQNEQDHIKIMLATDNHIGFMERDPVRGQDSINTFKEILELARDHDVDFILLAGDLFHENKPSRGTLHQTMALLREYTLGDKPVQVELLSDPTDGQADGFSFPAINYEDSNLNVAIPVFSIHGNHDDPQGAGPEGALSALDMLSVAGLVNYFGKIDLPSDDAAASAPSTKAAAKGGLMEKGIRIRPVLLQKGNTRLALYGVGNIKDERMHYELRSNRVRMYRPAEDPDQWFNMLLIHQNRAAHNPKACVPESMFDDSIHLVVWGHEHEQLIQPQPVMDKRYYITQPGSSVATSLCAGEASEKCVAIVHVENTDFMLEPIPLKTVRPFVMDDMLLADEAEDAGIALDDKAAVTKLLKNRVHELIQKADQEWEAKHADDDIPKMLPLIRLRVEYTSHDMGNPVRFGQDFIGKVANPKDILQFYKKRGGATRKDKPNSFVDVIDSDMMPSEKLEKVEVGSLVKEYLQAQNLDILNPDGLERAVTNFVDKDDRDAITSFVAKMLRSTEKGLVTINPDEAQLDAELEMLREEQQRRPPKDAEDGGDASAAGPASRSRTADGADSDDSMLLDMDDDGFDNQEEAVPTKKNTSAEGGAKSRGSASASSSSRAKKTQHNRTFLGDDEDESDIAEVAPPPPATSSRAAALSRSTTRSRKKAPAKAAAAPTSRSTTGRAAARKATSRLASASSARSQDEEHDDDAEEENEEDFEDSAPEDDFENTAAARRTVGRTRTRARGRR